MSDLFSKTVSVPDSVLFQELDGEAVLLNLETEVYFGLNNSGTAMWQRMIVAPHIEAAYQQLLVDYEVEPEQLRVDLVELLQQLEAQKLIVLT